MRQQPPPSLSPAQGRYVAACLFVTGASTLVLEIAGTRVISPYYGSSLYCWSALITVTLIALAGGYSLGGRFADRTPHLTLFARLLCFGGLAVAFVPVLRVPVLKATSALGVQLGALASATALVAPALLLLSALGPLAIRLTASGLDDVGRSSGDVYALSTLGSVIGAVLAGFVLIPHVPVSTILYALACLLLLLGALGFRLSSAKQPLGSLAAAAAAALLALWPRHAPATNILFNQETAYGQVKVVDFQDQKRYLLVNGASQSVMLLKSGESDSQYIRSLEWAPLLRPAAKRALVIGLGAGLLPKAFEREYGLVTDAIEIDPVVARVAREHFGFAPRGEVFVADGRTQLELRPTRYGLVVLDAFGAESPPHHLFTREAFEAIKRRLEPGGVLAINFVSLLDPPGDAAWLSAYRTLASVFPELRAYRASDPIDRLGNILFFASDAPLEDTGASEKARPYTRHDIQLMLSREVKPGPRELARARLLEDDYAPIEFLLAATAKRWRSLLQRSANEVLLY